VWRRRDLDEDTIGKAISRALAALLVAAAVAPGCAESRSGSEQDTSIVEPAIVAADSIVAAWVDAGRIPGAVLLVARNGEVVHERAYGASRLTDYGSGQYPRAGGGYGDSTTRDAAAEDSAEAAVPSLARLPRPVPMTTETVFDLASVTKVMATTMAVMLLVDRGALDVDALVVTYLDDFRGEGKDLITVEHLLTHTAGLYQWQPTYYYAANKNEAYEYIGVRVHSVAAAHVAGR